MSTEVGAAYYTLGLDDSKLKAGLVSARQQISSLSKTSQESLQNISDVFRQIEERTLGAVKTGLTVLNAGLGVVAALSLKTASSFQQQRVAFETMLGSGEKAGKLMDDITKFAKTTPFELPQLIEGTKRLMAFGISENEVLDNMKTLGNIASGVGMEKLPQLILAFGQVKAATKLTGMELRQFTEAGVPLLDELAKVTGKTADRIKADMEGGAAISFDTVRKALGNLSGEGGRFNNLMDTQSKTLAGTVSNLKDSFTLFGLSLVGVTTQGEIMKDGFFDVVNQKAQDLYGWISNNQDKLREWGTSIGEFIVGAGKWLIDIITSITEFFRQHKIMIETIVTTYAVLKTALMIDGVVNTLRAAVELLVVQLKAAGTGAFVLSGKLAAIPTSIVITVGIATILKAIDEVKKLNSELDKAQKSAAAADEAEKRLFEKMRQKFERNEISKDDYKKFLQNQYKIGIEKRAQGGPVMAGRPYLVNEGKPEVFVPNLTGKMVPMREIATDERPRVKYDINIGAFIGSPADARKLAVLLNDEMQRLQLAGMV